MLHEYRNLKIHIIKNCVKTQAKLTLTDSYYPTTLSQSLSIKQLFGLTQFYFRISEFRLWQFNFNNH